MSCRKPLAPAPRAARGDATTPVAPVATEHSIPRALSTPSIRGMAPAAERLGGHAEACLSCNRAFLTDASFCNHCGAERPLSRQAATARGPSLPLRRELQVRPILPLGSTPVQELRSATLDAAIAPAVVVAQRAIEAGSLGVDERLSQIVKVVAETLDEKLSQVLGHRPEGERTVWTRLREHEEQRAAEQRSSTERMELVVQALDTRLNEKLVQLIGEPLESDGPVWTRLREQQAALQAAQESNDALARDLEARLTDLQNLVRTPVGATWKLLVILIEKLENGRGRTPFVDDASWPQRLEHATSLLGRSKFPQRLADLDASMGELSLLTKACSNLETCLQEVTREQRLQYHEHTSSLQRVLATLREEADNRSEDLRAEVNRLSENSSFAEERFNSVAAQCQELATLVDAIPPFDELVASMSRVVDAQKKSVHAFGHLGNQLFANAAGSCDTHDAQWQPGRDLVDGGDLFAQISCVTATLEEGGVDAMPSGLSADMCEAQFSSLAETVTTLGAAVEDLQRSVAGARDLIGLAEQASCHNMQSEVWQRLESAESRLGEVERRVDREALVDRQPEQACLCEKSETLHGFMEELREAREARWDISCASAGSCAELTRRVDALQEHLHRCASDFASAERRHPEALQALKHLDAVRARVGGVETCLGQTAEEVAQMKKRIGESLRRLLVLEHRTVERRGQEVGMVPLPQPPGVPAAEGEESGRLNLGRSNSSPGEVRSARAPREPWCQGAARKDSRVCACGSPYILKDTVFCRKCGAKRPSTQ